MQFKLSFHAEVRQICRHILGECRFLKGLLHIHVSAVVICDYKAEMLISSLSVKLFHVSNELLHPPSLVFHCRGYKHKIWTCLSQNRWQLPHSILTNRRAGKDKWWNDHQKKSNPNIWASASSTEVKREVLTLTSHILLEKMWLLEKNSKFYCVLYVWLSRQQSNHWQWAASVWLRQLSLIKCFSKDLLSKFSTNAD